MSQAQNRYKADLRELQFLLFEQFGLGDVLGKAPFANWGTDEVKMTRAARHFDCDLPLNRRVDPEKARALEQKANQRVNRGISTYDISTMTTAVTIRVRTSNGSWSNRSFSSS